MYEEVKLYLIVIVAVLYFWSVGRQKITPAKRYSNETILFMGVLFTALCLSQMGIALDNGSGNVAPLFLLGCVMHGVIAWFGRSGLIGLFCLLALGSDFGTSTGYSSGWGMYWLGMHYPIRSVLFAGVLLAACYSPSRSLWSGVMRKEFGALGKGMSLFPSPGDMSHLQATGTVLVRQGDRR